MVSPLLARVAQLCDELDALGDPAARPAVAAVRSSLSEPLRLAVVGIVSAGKSTLVNALVGRQVAPTSAGECTRVVTWYRYGTPDRAAIELRDGTSRNLPLVAGALPAELDVPVEEIARLVVHLQSARLRDLALIDTPGLATLTEANDRATRQAILGQEVSQAAAGEADALLYAFREAERRTDLDFLRRFHEAAGQMSSAAVNTIGVLTQADRFSAAEPVRAGQELADRIAADHVADLADVIAVSGLLAQSAETGLSQSIVRTLVELRDQREPVLRNWQNLPLPPEQRARIAEVVGGLTAWGLRAAREAAAAGPTALREWCRRESGFERLEQAIGNGLVPRSEAIKADRALGVLRRIAQRMNDSDRALTLVEAALLSPALQPVDELRMLQRLLRNTPESSLRMDLERLLGGSDDGERLGLPPGSPDGEVRREAVRLTAEIREFAALAVDDREKAAAQVVARSYQHIAARASQAVVPAKA